MSKSFGGLTLRPELIEAARKQGFKAPTPIQALVVPQVQRGRDAVVEAKTGSGKTLAYGWPLLDREPLQTEHPEALVIVPTRELALQIEEALVAARGTLERGVVALVGRGGLDRQERALKNGAFIAVGTLGRIGEAIERGVLRLDRVRTVVLDEVDELVKGGFSKDLAPLLGQLPKERQTLLFSASVPVEVEDLFRRITTDPARLKLTQTREQAAELSHRVLFTSVESRLADLVGYLKSTKPFQTVVFCGTRHETESLVEGLAAEGLQAEYLHGELSPNKRRQLIEKVRSGDLPLLVASDIAARGLDLPGVDVVVNWSLPKGQAAYMHRAGRTGRAGRPGVVLNLLIEQQHVLYERLKPVFDFESVEVTKTGNVIKRKPKTREERDLKYRKLPETTERKGFRLSRPKAAPSSTTKVAKTQGKARPKATGKTTPSRRPPRGR